jgi:glycine cleavage system pyridoxal-binding protein P
MANTHYVRSRIREIKGYAIPHEAPCFKEFTVRVRRGNMENLIGNMAQRGLIIGPSLGQFNPEWRDLFLISTTEVRAREEMDSLLCALKEEA